MKPRFLFSTVILFLFIHHSSEQGFSFNPLLTNLSNGTTGTINSSNSLVNTLRNTTNNLILRLEGPRDRVVGFIKPVVKSDFSRNLTNVLDNLWNRVQARNISIIQHPLVKNSIVIPINTTIQRLKQITAKEDLNNNADEINESNFEIVDLGDSENARVYLVNADSLNSEETTMKTSIQLNDDKPVDVKLSGDKPVEAKLNDDKPVEAKLNNNKPVEEKTSNLDKEAELDNSNLPKSRRARFMDNYTYVNPNNVRNLFDNVQQNGMRECFALALCESNCRPNLYSTGSHGRFRKLFDRFESYNLDHEDSAYYLDARRFGQSYYGQHNHFDECSWCHNRYSCPHEREYLVNQFTKMGNFY